MDPHDDEEDAEDDEDRADYEEVGISRKQMEDPLQASIRARITAPKKPTKISHRGL